MQLLEPKSWAGVWTALVTPFQEKSGTKSWHKQICSDSLEKLINDQANKGIRGLVIAGSTGEGSLLGQERYTELLTLANSFNKGRMALVAGLGIGGTETSAKNAELAMRLSYDGVLAAAPAYVKAPQRELVGHFIEVANVGLPVCVYEVPSRAAQSISISTLEKIVSHSSPASKFIKATKDASSDLERAGEIYRIIGNRIAHLSGEDGTFLPYLSLCGSGKASGVISVVSHLVPKQMKSIYDHFLNSEISEASKIQTRLLPLISSCFSESNPIPVKALLKKIGLIKSDGLLPPLGPLDSEKLSTSWNLWNELKDS